MISRQPRTPIGFEQGYEAPLTPRELQSGGVRNVAQTHSNIQTGVDYDPMEEYDYEQQALEWQNKNDQVRAKISQQRTNNFIQRAVNQNNRIWNAETKKWENQVGNANVQGETTVFQGVKNPSLNFMAFANAIAGQETGGIADPYSATGVTTSSGDYAMGKYQIMRSHIAGPGGWDEQILGRSITPQRFMNRPRLQERIAQGMLRPMFRQHGVKGAASEWYSGDPDNWMDTSDQGSFPSIRQYVQEVQDRYEIERKKLQNQMKRTSGLNSMIDPLKGKGNWDMSSAQDFGPRSTSIGGGSGFHTGIDLAAPEGTPVYAAHSGRIGVAGYDSGYGNQVVINAKGPGRSSYSHLATIMAGLNKGDRVKRGQLIGFVGDTGSYSEGNHLHFETWKRGKERNPMRFFRRSGVVS